jgi:DNA-binding PadR family transcriptional regulator
MIKGYLKIVFLRELKNKKSSGYDLMKSAEYILGKKPSAGSVYPLLKQLLDDGFIGVKEDNKKKLYSITKKGEDLLVKLTKEKEKMLSSHEELMNLFSQIDKKSKEHKSLFTINKQLKLEDKIILRNMDIFLELKKEIDSIFFNKNLTLKNEEEVRKIIKQTINKLKAVRKKK